MSDPTREMLEDARLQLDMLREALGVSVEPHQSLFERMMEKARGASLTDTAIADAADDLAATRKQLAEAQARLQSIAEYWNRDENEEAMSDALWHIIEVAESTETSCLEAARREGEDRVIDKLLAAQANENAARSMCEDFRRQLAEAQADNAAMHSAAHRLALEAECFYMDCKDMALVSKWDDPLQTAISDVHAIRWSGDTSALSAAIAEAVEPYKRDAEKHCSISDAFAKQLTSDLVATRKQLAEAQAQEPIAWAVYHGVWKVLPSKYVAEEYAKNNFGDVHPVLSDVSGSDALSAAIAEAVEPYKRDAERWRNLNPYYTAAVFDPEREDGLDLGEGIALIFIIPKGSRVSGNADATIDALAAKEAP